MAKYRFILHVYGHLIFSTSLVSLPSCQCITNCLHESILTTYGEWASHPGGGGGGGHFYDRPHPLLDYAIERFAWKVDYFHQYSSCQQLLSALQLSLLLFCSLNSVLFMNSFPLISGRGYKFYVSSAPCLPIASDSGQTL